MSLLDRGNAVVDLYPEVAVTDRDGNIRTCASDVSFPLEVWLQPQGQSGTAARRAEQDNEGYESEKVVRMRMLRKNHGIIIGAQAKIGWNGQMWSVFGDVSLTMGSPRTAHHVYLLRRA